MSAARIPVVVLGDTARAIHHGCRQVMENLARGLTAIGCDITARHPGPGWRNDPTLVAAMKQARAIIINGEGTIHHDRPGGAEYMAAAEFARDHGVPVFLINCTWAANSPELSRRAAVFRRIYVRESFSQQELAAAGIVSTVVPDLTLATPAPPPATTRRGWWITDSAQTATTERLYRLTRQIPNAAFAPILASDWHATSPGRRAKRHFQRWLGRHFSPLAPARYVALAHALPDAATYLRAMTGVRAVLTGRFHAACFALVTGTPFLAVRANTTKLEALLQDAGLRSDRLLAESELTPSTVGARLDTVAWDTAEAAHLAAYVARAQTAIAAMFAHIAQEAR